MKTYEEMARDALERIDQYKVKQKSHKKNIIRIAVPVASFCIITALGLGIWKSGLLKNELQLSDVRYRPSDNATDNYAETSEQNKSSNNNSTTENNGVTETNSNTEKDKNSNVKIITGKSSGQKGADANSTSGFCEFWWKKKLVMSGPLYNAIEANPGCTYAVIATYRPATANITSFTYNGKTLSELAIAADNERLLPEKMTELLKLGEDLKYGTALYETGTPSGIKWSKQLYEEKVAYFGKELLSKYIVDGKFLRSDLERDIAALPKVNQTTPSGTTTTTYNSNTSAREKYTKAYNAYLETVLPSALKRLTDNNIKCERNAYSNNSLTIFVTEKELENLPLDDLKNWYFDLSSDNLKGISNNKTDIAGFQVVN